METLQVQMPISPIKNGVTKPYIINCSGEEYVVKFLQNPEGHKALINEYVCAEVARILELPLASPSLIEVGDTFVNDYGKEISRHTQEEIKAGIHFGTKKIKKVFPINTPQIVKRAYNKDIIPDLFVFDQIICNKDRDSNGGNLIFDYEKQSIVVIDHTHAFDIGPLWDEHQLKIRIGEKFEPFNMTGYVYHKLVPFVDGHNPFSNILQKLQVISIETLKEIMDNIPQSWNINENEKDVLVNYLMDRINRVEEILECLHLLLPKWKGGVT
ncbi:HipA family kinase [Oceanobacillus halophilus]|uniref:HipA-like kinase domain-containing protein n=1 Tax=Oceanobacillus halophilus TaxID=930130 RepID=A0A495A3R9_9BACI|nr:HipA family kinase [Oceanobacillus halophilus]RKQ34265.1 hypothetical protein D8M06_07745 [Oceanobacillus halophilus]